MGDSTETPLAPIYPYNEPGQSILLFEGLVGGLSATDVPGSVELVCTPRPRIEWTAQLGELTKAQPTSGSQVELLLHRSQGDECLPARVREFNFENSVGWSNGATLGKTDEPLERIIAHWFNLPNSHGPIGLNSRTDDGMHHSWSGRWIIEANGWKITFDVRPDHHRVWRDLYRTHVYVMTHVMDLRRVDGKEFTAADAEYVLTALHVGISFALGYWAAPMLPVGLDAGEKIVWENWCSYHCDPARSIGLGWWYDQDIDSLGRLLGDVIEGFTDPERLVQLRFQMMLAIIAISDKGFVEQRITSGAAGLEHIAWQDLVLSGRMTEDEYNGYVPYNDEKLHAAQRLRILLKEAGISVDIDDALLPSAAAFISREKQRQGRTLDGADVVTQIRNRLVHPKGAQENVYHLEELLGEVWLLIRHYLSLLILHSLGYEGAYRDLRKRQGWVGDVAKVPWAEADA